MFRALFRRLTFVVSLVVLLSIALSSVAPTASAKSLSKCPGILDPSGYCHLYVATNVPAPNGGTADTVTEGAYGNFGQYHPYVDKGDLESLAQITVDDGTHAVEVGWYSYYGSTKSVIFVATRDLGNKTTCIVQLIQGTSNGWTCDFISFRAFNTTGYYPGYPIPPNAPPAFIYVLNTGDYIYIQYGADWLGQIPVSHWSGQSFGPVKTGEWQGEVAVKNPVSTSTAMGNGICGSSSDSATIDSMTWFVGQSGSGTFQPVNAPSSTFTVTIPSYYNYGHLNGSSFTYGGPGAHKPSC